MTVDLLGYGTRVAPALVLTVALYALLRGKQALPLRIMVVIIGFLVVRDTLVVFDVWGYHVAHGWLPYVRFVNEPFLVMGFAVGSVVMTLILVMVEWDGWRLLFWGRFTWSAVGWALGGGAVIAGVLVAAYQTVPLSERGGALPQIMLVPMLAVATCGNLTEDILVRGYVQGYLGTFLSPVRAAISSGFFFALCHVFLAVAITGLGIPVLVYALFDGLVCAFVRMKAGLIPAAVAHGMGIIVLAMGLI